MTAYWVVHVTVKDPDAFQEYARRSPAALKAFGGRHIVRGGESTTFEGAPDSRRLVVAEFPDYAAALACYRSDTYQSIIKHREGAAEFHLVAIDGCPPQT
ncbi:MAG: DUF1330 domain-containing protein [Pseudomonadota bacterium]